MAHLEVKRKRSSNWWIWVLVLLIVLAVAYYFFRDRIDVNALTSNGTSAAVLAVARRVRRFVKPQNLSLCLMKKMS